MNNIKSPRTDDGIEQEIIAKGLTAPRVTPTDIEANIAHEWYFTASEGAQLSFWADCPPDLGAEGMDKYAEGEPRSDGPLGLLTICILELRNGFTVLGESACASLENFNAEIGRKIARADAANKLRPLMGYALKESLSKPQPLEA